MNSREVGLEIPDCTQCGACCAQGPLWVEVSEQDLARLRSKRSDLNLVEQGDVEPYAMKTRGDGQRCIALKGSVGSSCMCLVYEDRPQPCRDFVKWSPPCVYAVGLFKLGKFTW